MADAPSIKELAAQVAGAMVALEPVIPIAWARGENQDGKPLYMVAVVMGPPNVRMVERALETLKAGAQPVDIFDGTDGEPEKR